MTNHGDALSNSSAPSAASPKYLLLLSSRSPKKRKVEDSDLSSEATSEDERRSATATDQPAVPELVTFNLYGLFEFVTLTFKQFGVLIRESQHFCTFIDAMPPAVCENDGQVLTIKFDEWQRTENVTEPAFALVCDIVLHDATKNGPWVPTDPDAKAMVNDGTLRKHNRLLGGFPSVEAALSRAYNPLAPSEDLQNKYDWRTLSHPPNISREDELAMDRFHWMSYNGPTMMHHYRRLRNTQSDVQLT